MADAAGIIFDLDGTLMDNNYFHAIAWWRACRDLGEQVPMSTLHRLIGMGSDHLIDTLFHREWGELSEAHSKHFKPFVDESVAFKGAKELLTTLAARGATVVLGTSAHEDDLKRLRRTLDADEAISEVAMSEDVEATKPAPDIFEVALKKSGVTRAIVVGDTRWDIEAARKSGLDCVCVCTGGWSRAELEEAGAVAVYDDVAGLLDELDSSPLAAFLDGRDG